MTTRATKSALKVPGRLVKDPTDLSAAFPYGGTELGLVSEVVVRPRAKHQVLTAEEWGELPWDVVYGGTSFLFGCLLRGVDDDAYAAIWPDTASGTPSGDKKVLIRDDNGRAGTLLSTLSMELLFVPDAALRHRAVIIRDALPAVAEDAEIRFSMTEEWGLRVVWYCRPDSSNRIAEIAYIGDMSL